MNKRWPAFLMYCLIQLFPTLLIPVAPTNACAAAAEVHDSPMEEEIDFFQYTDDADVIHFVDSREKIPARYRSRAIVRKETPSARQTTKVVFANNQIHLPVTIRNGERTVQATLLLDTGAATTVVTEELAVLLNLDLTTSRPAITRMADGSEVDVSLVTVNSVSVGKRERSPMEIAVIHHKGSRELHDGLLGLDFLNGFQYQLDVYNELIRWQ